MNTIPGVYIIHLKFGRGIKAGVSAEAVRAKVEYEYGARDIESIEEATIDDILGVRGMGGFLPLAAKEALQAYWDAEV